MTGKTINLGKRPESAPEAEAQAADAWVRDRSETTEKMKRLTIDIEAGLHKRLKAYCVQEGTTIAELLRDFIQTKVG